MEAVHTCETSVYFNETTQRYNPEDCIAFLGMLRPQKLSQLLFGISYIAHMALV
jgi:hypothetical protein